MFRFDIVTIGSITFDIFLKGFKYDIVKNKKFISQKGLALDYSSKTGVDQLEYHSGGGALNTGVLFSNFGLKTAIISRLGNDFAAQIIRERIKECQKLDFSLLQTDDRFSTAASCILVTGDGEKTILSYKGCGANLNEEEMPFSQIQTKVLYLGSASGNKNIIQKSFDYKKKNPFTILASNPGNKDLEILKKHPSWLKGYDIFIINQNEAAYLSDIPYKKEKQIFQWLIWHTNGICIITQGPKGLMAYDRKNIYHTGVYDVKVIDSTGAGDAFSAGFTAGYILKNDIIYSLKLGLANASQVIQKIGANSNVLKPNDLNSQFWKKAFNQLKITSERL